MPLETPTKPAESTPLAPVAPEPLCEPDPLLMRAAEIVRERWQQDSYGAPGGSRCVLGALREAAGPRFRYDEDPLYRRVASSLGVDSLAEWNDAPGRKAEEVGDALERAAHGL